MLGPATTLITVNNISIVVTGQQAVTMSPSCCFRYEEGNGMIIFKSAT